MNKSAPVILLAYPETKGFSGMTEATRQIVRVLEGASPYRFVKCASVGRGSGQSTIPYIGALLWSFVKNLCTLASYYPSKNVIYYLNLSQTLFGFCRDGLPVLLATLLKSRKRLVISLHGNLFMGWKPRSLISSLFLFQLKRASLITVLGPKQLEHLVRQGIGRDKIRIVDNASFTEIAVNSLHQKLAQSGGPLHILHLSNLIESKGYPIFLEALLMLAQDDAIEVDGVLCGKFLNEPNPKYPFSSEWINEK